MARCVRVMSVLLTAAVVLGGCSKKMTIYSIPPWYTKDIKSVAVQEFRNSSGRPDAAGLSSQLATALMSNGTYRVMNRQDLRALMDERDLQAALEQGDPQASAEALRKIGKVDAILTGVITSYRVDTDRQRVSEPNMVWDPGAKAMVQRGTKTYTKVRHDAIVEVSASLVRVADGQPLGSTQGTVTGADFAEGTPPSKSAGQCMVIARNEAVAKLVESFAIIRKEIKVKPKEVLKISSGRPAGEWIEKDKFTTADAVMFIVVDLPMVCDRNQFRFEIAREKETKALLTQELNWTQGDCGLGGKPFQYSPAEIAQLAGPGDYYIRFYSGLDPKPVFDRKFTVKAPKS
ncbi:MAG: CsgG/HfaB family protein [Phycisphaerae bacterium]